MIVLAEGEPLGGDVCTTCRIPTSTVAACEIGITPGGSFGSHPDRNFFFSMCPRCGEGFWSIKQQGKRRVHGVPME